MYSIKNNQNIFRHNHQLQRNKNLFPQRSFQKKTPTKSRVETIFDNKHKKHHNSKFGSNTKNFLSILDIVAESWLHLARIDKKVVELVVFCCEIFRKQKQPT